MYLELLELIDSIRNPYLKQLLEEFFVKDKAFTKAFRYSSAAKTVHHGFVGGLLEHTLSVTKLCEYYCSAYPILKRDLLLTAAMCHDIGKVKEISLSRRMTTRMTDSCWGISSWAPRWWRRKRRKSTAFPM